jgi:Spo0E like sporulation regulatory protein.
MSEKYNKSELKKAIKNKHAELNAVVDAAIEKGEKINEAEVMRISKGLDLLINQYMKLITDTEDTCI